MNDKKPELVPPQSFATRRMETQLLEQRLLKMEPGEFVSYDDLTAVCGVDVRGAGYPLLASARKAAGRALSTIFDAVRGEGIKRLEEDEKVAAVSRLVSRGRKTIRKAGDLSCRVDYDAISDDKRRELNGLRGAIVASIEFIKPTAIKKISEIATASPVIPTQEDIMAAFKKK